MGSERLADNTHCAKWSQFPTDKQTYEMGLHLATEQRATCPTQCPLLGGGLNRPTQHFILKGKDGV